MGHLVATYGKTGNTVNTVGNVQDIFYSDDNIDKCIQFDKNDPVGDQPGFKLGFTDFFNLQEILIFTEDSLHNHLDRQIEIYAGKGSDLNSALYGIIPCATTKLAPNAVTTIACGTTNVNKIFIRSKTDSLRLCHMAILGDDGSHLPTACATTGLEPHYAWANFQDQSYKIGDAMASFQLNTSNINPTDPSLIPDFTVCGRIVIELVQRNTTTISTHPAVWLEEINDNAYQVQWYSDEPTLGG